MIEGLKNYLVGCLNAPAVEGDDPEGWTNSSLARVFFDGKAWFYDLPNETTMDQFARAAVKEFNAYCWLVAEHEVEGWMRVELDTEPMPDDFWDEEEDEDEKFNPEELQFMEGVEQGFFDLGNANADNPFDRLTDATRYAGWKAASESKGGPVEINLPSKRC